jgi:hypothetical protein
LAAVAVLATVTALAADNASYGQRAEWHAARAAAARPRCFGAASRDPEHVCINPKLRYSVVPTPSEAQIMPGSPCTPIKRTRLTAICAFGVRSRRARATIALVGDSHAAHWRPALEVVARAKRWRALSFYRSQCQFTTAVTNLPEPARTRCIEWNKGVVRWFRAHPSVHVVFVSQNSYAGVTIPSGQDQFAAKIAGYSSAWHGLPASVRHIVVIRDTPKDLPGTQHCIQQAMARHEAPGLTCAVPRAKAIDRDAAVTAARIAAPRVQVVDLNRYFCDTRRCYPVIGGALVHKDDHHMTVVFATTLGPYLERAVDRLMRTWKV